MRPDPDLTVVIASRDRPRRLRACLESLVAEGVGTDTFEVIVAVDRADHRTGALLASFDAPWSLRAHVHEWTDRVSALNGAGSRAAGRYLLFIDDRGVADPELMAAHLSEQRRAPVIGVGLIRHSDRASNSPFLRWLDAQPRLRTVSLTPRDGPNLADVSIGNLSMPKAGFAAANGFASGLPAGHAIELCHRLQRRGHALVSVGAALTHAGSRSITVLREEEALGQAAVELLRRHPEILDRLPLGYFHETSLRAVLLRHLLLRVGISPGMLAPFGRAARASAWSGEWYRFLMDYAYWRGVRRVAGGDLWARLTAGNVILMYHAIGRRRERASRYVVPPGTFLRQMQMIRRSGRPTISLDAYAQQRHAHQLPPAGAIIVTLDDGYADNALANRIVNETLIPATIFLTTGMIGDRNRWDAAGILHDRPLLTWNAIRKMHRDGMAFGCHSQHHPRLDQIDETVLAKEVQGSARDFERELGVAPTTFAYPYGDHDATVRASVRDAGFAVACAGVKGKNSPATDWLALRRTEVRGTYGRLRFAIVLWLGVPDPVRRLVTGR